MIERLEILDLMPFDALRRSAVYVYWRYKKFHKTRFNQVPSKVLVVSNDCDWEIACGALQQEFDCGIKVVGFDCEWGCGGHYASQNSEPVALLQLATVSGLCILVRLCQMKSIPKTLQVILADRSILKIGLACLDDSQKLLRDHGISCAGCVDLRHIVQRTNRSLARQTSLGLRSLAKEVLNIELDKSWTVRRSNWEAETLSAPQVAYAAADALVAVQIFMALIDSKYGITDSYNGSKIAKRHSDNIAVMQRVLSVCQGLTDAKYTLKNAAVHQGASNATKRVSVPRDAAAAAAGGAAASKAYVVRQKPLYHNCQLRSPDGQLLCTCDIKKALWYTSKGLGVQVSDDPIIVQLLFEPNGRPLDESNYYLHEKENVCVVCGASESYIRKNIIPREYRKHFPSVLKEHKSHDVLLMCVACHQRSNLYDNELKFRLLKECLPDAQLFDGRSKYTSDQTLVKVRSAAKALLSPNVERIPKQRLEELREVIKNFYGVQQISTDLLQQAVTIETEVKRDGFEDQGQLVVQHVVEHMEGGLVAFERQWRQHFLDTMQPQHLPALWSVDHSHSQWHGLERSILTDVARSKLSGTEWVRIDRSSVLSDDVF